MNWSTRTTPLLGQPLFKTSFLKLFSLVYISMYLNPGIQLVAYTGTLNRQYDILVWLFIPVYSVISWKHIRKCRNSLTERTFSHQNGRQKSKYQQQMVSNNRRHLMSTHMKHQHPLQLLFCCCCFRPRFWSYSTLGRRIHWQFVCRISFVLVWTYTGIRTSTFLVPVHSSDQGPSLF